MTKRIGSRDNLNHDPRWYKSGVIYEVHVRAFHDSDGNGTGDFRGLTEKLGYLQDLGITAVWLLPFYPSPLRDDGYDIADYYSVHSLYGTLADFRVFLDEAHRRGLRVITELVLNHTSDAHPWFQRARRAKKGSRWRNYYVWSDDPQKYKDADIVFKDVESSNWAWDPVAQQHYWHRFFSHQPDLNYENPEIHEEIFKVVDFWLDLGVDGLRLDAVPYLYEAEGTDCENLPQTHAFLKQLRAHVDAQYGDRMLLAEANLWPEDAVAYFGKDPGDECHMAFHFPLMPRLFMGLRMEDRLPIVDILEQTPAIPQKSQWALFLRNHDELTLSMVTDEERDYMYRMYAQAHQARLYLGIRRRLAPLLGNDRRRIELLNALLFSLPGTPVLYYGDEIGLGENIFLGDRNGVRTPMQWSSDKNAGFSRANPQSLYLPIILAPEYHYEAVNVEVQLANPNSLLWWMRRVLALRKRWRALGEGQCEFLHPENRKVISYVLRHGEEVLLVVANLSRFSQAVELDLSAFRQRTPVELFGRSEFPPIADGPYRLSLTPHGFYWFSLEPKPAATQAERRGAPGVHQPHSLTLSRDWKEILKPGPETEAALSSYLQSRDWFHGNAKELKSVLIKNAVPLALEGGETAHFAFLQVEYLHDDPETYFLPLAVVNGAEARRIREETARFVIAELKADEPGEPALLIEAGAAEAFRRALPGLFGRPRSRAAQLDATHTPHPHAALQKAGTLKSEVFATDDSAFFYGDQLVLKLFRRVEPGPNPELEITRWLTNLEFPHCTRLAGALETRDADGSTVTLGMAREFVPNAVNAWHYTLDALSRYFDRAITWVAQRREPPPGPGDWQQWLQRELPVEVDQDLGTYLESARRLAERLAEFHLAMASGTEPDFAPESFTMNYQRGLFQSMRSVALENLRRIRKQLPGMPPEVSALARRVVELQPVIIQVFRKISERRITARRIRIHGDCHLRQMLWTGKDFVFFDFHGNSRVRPGERRIKRSPLRDVAAMVRSFHYAAHGGLRQHFERGSIPEENRHKFEPWVRYWNWWTTMAFVRAYLAGLEKSNLLPADQTELQILFEASLLNQAFIELGGLLPAGSENVTIPLRAILYLSGEQTP